MSAIVSFFVAAELEEPPDGVSERLPQLVTRISASETINAMSLCIVIFYLALQRHFLVLCSGASSERRKLPWAEIRVRRSDKAPLQARTKCRCSANSCRM